MFYSPYVPVILIDYKIYFMHLSSGYRSSCFIIFLYLYHIFHLYHIIHLYYSMKMLTTPGKVCIIYPFTNLISCRFTATATTATSFAATATMATATVAAAAANGATTADAAAATAG